MKVVNILLCVIFLLSCTQTKKNSPLTNNKSTTVIKPDNVSTNKSVVNKLKDESVGRSNIVHFAPVKVDTIIGDIHISYIIRDNDGIVSTLSYDDNGKGEITNFADRSVFINLKRGNKNILSNREIKKPDFASIIPKNEIGKYHLCYFGIKRIENNGATFLLNICKPDTDICYGIELLISNQGVFTFKEIDEGEMGD